LKKLKAMIRFEEIHGKYKYRTLEQFRKSKELERKIKENLAGLGYEI